MKYNYNGEKQFESIVGHPWLEQKNDYKWGGFRRKRGSVFISRGQRHQVWDGGRWH